jgi:hypothetical protein
MELITQITQSIIKANDARLDGTITREHHAMIIKQYNRALVANHYTWKDVEKESDRLQKETK